MPVALKDPGDGRDDGGTSLVMRMHGSPVKCDRGEVHSAKIEQEGQYRPRQTEGLCVL